MTKAELKRMQQVADLELQEWQTNQDHKERSAQARTIMNQSDKAAAELAATVDSYAPDYVAPCLTNLLVKTARKIGLSRETVIAQIENIWDMSEHFDPKGNGLA